MLRRISIIEDEMKNKNLRGQVTTMGGGGGRTELRTLLVWFALAKDGSQWWEEVDIQDQNQMMQFG
jgi:hypothetical protein